MHFKLKSKVWIYPGPPERGGSWHFVNVSKKASREIKDTFGRGDRGFGSIPVTVTVGTTSWDTSIFPDKKSGTYLLPIKAEVRKAEDVREGKLLSLTIQIRL
jgi:hypothetical protein